MGQIQESESADAAGLPDWSRAQRAAVLTELNQILADPVFSKSKRCADLLRRLVEQGLSGEHEGVKERTLGIEVFGRRADYDSNADPIVRRTANEIRKRLAQYYQKVDPPTGLKIHLIPGSYIPEFEFCAATAVVDVPAPEVQEQIPEPVGSPQPETVHLLRYGRLVPFTTGRGWKIASALALCLLVCGLTLANFGVFRSSQYQFWRPLLQVKDLPFVCVADQDSLEWNGVKNSAQTQTIASVIASRGGAEVEPSNGSPRAIPYVDANVAHQLAGWLAENGRSTVLEPASMLTLQEFRRRPAVLVGGFDNPWTLSLLSGLRFSPRLDPAQNVLWIRDAQNPANRTWVYAGQQSRDSITDYAVITRLFDSETRNWLVAVAGLGQHGTDAASQFLTDPVFSSSFPRGVRSNKNVQMVIKTTIIRGNTGPPELVAFHTW